ncbi:MAG: peptidoglycan DD-metalloendopeptidase family protein [Methylophilus sp.]|nr:peptidoglycan DD-metalloendopeptidase family protein [Methylophilus sp.]
MMLQKILLVIASISLISCASSPPAPVINRDTSVNKPTASLPKDNGTNKSGTDWRPNTYTVKKGDTLYAIGLEFGYDYKEIASVNNLSPPYPIKVGQILSLPGSTTEKPIPTEEGDVVVTPITTDAVMSETKAAPPAVTPILSQPKAIREPYSLEALNRGAAKPNTEIANKPTATSDVAIAIPAETKATTGDAVTWIWPTNGKVVANFNEASNKGIDIAGTAGQAINAASSGKVIYSGSDLRGYGKLIIIKHNKTFLSVYAHNNKLLVKEGQIVAAGQKIAEMGNTDSNSVKLHFEIRQQGKSVDPAKYLPQN